MALPIAFGLARGWPVGGGSPRPPLGIPGNALLSPVDGRLLLSPFDGRILLRAS